MRLVPVSQHFEGRAPAVRAIYRQITRAAKAVGPFKEEPKKPVLL